MKPCQGGWCKRRENCPNYLVHSSERPADRLCEPGQDGVPRSVIVVRRVRWPDALDEASVYRIPAAHAASLPMEKH